MTPCALRAGWALGVLALTGSSLADPRPAPGFAERVEYRAPATPPSRGPTNALVTIEVFFVPGPNMPTGALRLLQQLQDRHPARIRLVYRILKSGSALLVPSAALEAQAAGKFFELMDELSRQRAILKKEDLLELARRVGVDPQRVALATQFEQYRDALEANQRRFERLHAGNTPSILFNSYAPKLSLSTLSVAELEREYESAYKRALDKLERGYPVRALAAAFDDEAMLATQPVVITGGSSDDEERSPLDHPLANPPLQLDRLPAFGKPGVAARVTIAVLCRPNEGSCSNLLRVVEPEVRLYPDDVRVVWAPWFDPIRDDASDLALLGDAALCAEAIGSNQGELTTSPGWVWIKEMYAQLSRSYSKKLTPDKLIEMVATKLEIDPRALTACRTKMANSSLAWIQAARRSGVPRTNSAVVIGGRIYDGLSDQTLIHNLVESELAPGVLGSLPRWDSP